MRKLSLGVIAMAIATVSVAVVSAGAVTSKPLVAVQVDEFSVFPQTQGAPAGKVRFVVGNMGWRTHEMVVLPLAAAQAAGQRVSGVGGKVDETGSLGEASASCAAGSGEGIEAGSVGWVTLNLARGRYEVVCNLRNHYANGMHQLLVVS